MTQQSSNRYRENIYFYQYDGEMDRGILSTIPQLQKGLTIQYHTPFRMGSSVVLLRGNIYLIGGTDHKGRPTAQVERMNLRDGHVTTGRVFDVAPMNFKRSLFSAVVSDHCILVFGGIGGNGARLSSCEKYDPFEDRWTPLPYMPTARAESGAVHVPRLGDLVLGGQGKSASWLRTGELLRVAGMNTGRVRIWVEIAPMIKQRILPSAVYVDESVIVTSLWEQSLEMLLLPPGFPCQWTLISGCTTPGYFPHSICVFNGRILLADVVNNGEEIFEPKRPSSNDDSSSNVAWKYVCHLPGICRARLLVDRVT